MNTPILAADRAALHQVVRRMLLEFMDWDDLEEIEPDQNFVALGTDSLQAVDFKCLLEDRFELALSTTLLFEYPSLEALVDYLWAQLHRPVPVAAQFDSGLPQTIAATEIQRGLWYITATGKRAAAFNVPLLFELTRVFDLELFQQAYRRVSSDHPALRVSFRQAGDGSSLEQVVGPVRRIAVVARFRGNAGERESWLWSQLRRPFPVDAAQLLRLAVAADEQGTTKQVMVVVHHLVIDGISAVLLINQWWRHYETLVQGAHLSAANPDTGFFAFVRHEQVYLAGEQARRDADWLSVRLADMQPAPALPYDRSSAEAAPAVGMGRVSFSLNGSVLASLCELTTRAKVTRAALFLSAFYVLLRNLCRESDLVVITPVALRPERACRASVGCLINLIATRLHFDGNIPLWDLLQTSAADFTAGLQHAAYPFSRLVADLGYGQAVGTEQAFPVSFTYQNIFAELPGEAELIAGVAPSFEIYQETADHLMLEVYDRGAALEVMLKFQRDRFDEANMLRYLAYLRDILAVFVADPRRPLYAAMTLPHWERARLLHEFQAPPALDDPTTVVARFVAQAARNPGAPAVFCGNRVFSYRELEQRSRALALHLRDQGVAVGEIVAVVCGRRAEQIIAILAVLRAGAIWLGLAGDQPRARIQATLRDANVRVVVDDGRARDALADADQSWINGCAASAVTCDSPLPRLDPNLTAYCIFTSGSSGRPKGVLVTHASLANLCDAMIETYTIQPEDRVCWFASPGFDMSVEELFPYLTVGAAVVVRRRNEVTAPAFHQLVVRARVTILNLPPQYYAVLQQLDRDRLRDLFARIRVLSFGGEALPDNTLRAVQQFDCRIFNAYGPTEATINAAIAECTHDDAVTIGRPIRGVRLYVLDPQLQLTPLGCVGELWIGGVAVAAGYLGRPRLTADRFRPNPFGPGRLYRSGDLVRWDRHGRLHFLGRCDDQLKIRGYRVEPGEVERVLAGLSGVDAAAVITGKSVAGQVLSAFYCSAQPLPDLRSRLAARLPAYMVPANLTHISKLPRNANGKIDRGALAGRQAIGPLTGATRVAPRDQLEQRLWVVWCRILGRDDFGIHDAFFELGGHSLLAIQVVGLFQCENPDYRLQVRDLLTTPTIADLAEVLQRRRAAGRRRLPAHVVVLREGGDRESHIVVPGMPGLADGYHELAEGLPDGAAVYGLQMRGFMGEPPLDSIEAMAAFNWELIDALALPGPFHLYTHSYGGIVVYEMLRQRPKAVLGRIVLIECHILKDMDRLTRDSIHLFCDAVVNFLQLDRELFYQRVASLFHLPADQWRRHLIAVIETSETPVDKRIFMNLLRLIEKAIAVDYQIERVLPHRVTLIEARCPPPLQASDTIAWSAVFAGCRVLKGEGDHVSIIRQPYLTSWLRPLLEGV